MRGRRGPEVVEFDAQHPEAVLAAMKEMATSRKGWVNVAPAVDVEDLPADAGPKLWSARGPLVPLCTWTPAEKAGSPVQVGIQHGAGSKAVPALRERGVEVPASWRVTSDNVRRGVVIAVPADEKPDKALKWLLRAGAALCTLPYEGWVAQVYGT